MLNDRLAAALVAVSGNVAMVKGVVTSVSPLRVSINGFDSPVTSYLDSYSPGLDNVVLVLVTNSAVVILGELVS